MCIDKTATTLPIAEMIVKLTTFGSS